MNLKELLNKGLIRKENAQKEEVKGSLAIAKHFLKRAEGNLKINFYDTAFLLAYTSMFHAAKALLLNAGYKERSHFGMIGALKELYSGDNKLRLYFDVLDNYRVARHSIQYSGELSSELDAVQAIKDCKAFIAAVEEFLKHNGRI